MLILVSCLTLFALACKKELTTANRNPIENAKEWYLKANLKMELKSSRKVENVTQDISWTDAKLYQQADGKEIIAVPVAIKLNSGTKASGSYLLMISKTDETYKHIIAYNAEKNHFTKSIDDEQVKNLYSNTLKANANRNSTGGTNASKGKVMVVEDDCTAFYLLETWYNEYGEIIEIYQHYLYTICEGMIDGGGEEEEEPEPIVEFGEADDTPLSMIMEENSNENKIVNVSWYCYKVNTQNLRFKSYEKIKIVPPIIGSQWLISDISHTSMTLEGTIAGQTVDYILNWSQGETTMNSAWAKMTLNFKDKRTYTYKNTTRTRYSADITAARSWGVYELVGF